MTPLACLSVLVAGLAYGKSAPSPDCVSGEHAGLRRTCADPISGTLYFQSLTQSRNPEQEESLPLVARTLVCGLTCVTHGALVNSNWVQSKLRVLQQRLHELGRRTRRALRRLLRIPGRPLLSPGDACALDVDGIAIAGLFPMVLMATVALRVLTRLQGIARKARCQDVDRQACSQGIVHSAATTLVGVAQPEMRHPNFDSKTTNLNCEFHRMDADEVSLATTMKKKIPQFTAESPQKCRTSELEAIYSSLTAEFHEMSSPCVDKRGLELS